MRTRREIRIRGMVLRRMVVRRGQDGSREGRVPGEVEEGKGGVEELLLLLLMGMDKGADRAVARLRRHRRRRSEVSVKRKHCLGVSYFSCRLHGG